MQPKVAELKTRMYGNLQGLRFKIGAENGGDTMNIETANRLLKYRKAHHFSQEELAEKIGVSRQAISKWERAEASPDTDNLILLSKIYGVTLDELLQGEEEPENNKADSDEKHQEENLENRANPDEETNYEEEKDIFSKNGIHIHDKGGDHVNVSFKGGIHVDTNDGTHVHIDRHGVRVKEGDNTRSYTAKNGHIITDEETGMYEERRKRHQKYANMVPVWMFALIAFFIWGFSDKCFGFGLSWICFLAIPLYYSMVEAIIKRDFNRFAYPVLCVAVYIIFGYFGICGGWNFGWIVFLTIPIYYCIIKIFNCTKENKNKNTD